VNHLSPRLADRPQAASREQMRATCRQKLTVVMRIFYPACIGKWRDFYIVYLTFFTQYPLLGMRSEVTRDPKSFLRKLTACAQQENASPNLSPSRNIDRNARTRQARSTIRHLYLTNCSVSNSILLVPSRHRPAIWNQACIGVASVRGTRDFEDGPCV